MDNSPTIDIAYRISGELQRLTDAIDLGTYREQHNRLYAARQALCWALDPEVAASPFASIMGNRAVQADCPGEHRPQQS
jgi:hypothetical protein